MADAYYGGVFGFVDLVESDDQSSDSQDEDYLPSNTLNKGPVALGKRNKKKTSKRRKKARRNRVASGSTNPNSVAIAPVVPSLQCSSDPSEGQSGSNVPPCVSLLDLPSEILLSIVSLVSSVFGVIPFLNSISQVCKLFRRLAHTPSLWRVVCLRRDPVPSVDKALKWLMDKHASDVHVLQLVSCKSITRQGLGFIWSDKTVGSTLRIIEINSCKSLNGNEIVELANHLANITHFISSGPQILLRKAANIELLVTRNSLQELGVNFCTDVLQFMHHQSTGLTKSKFTLLHLTKLTLTSEVVFDQEVLYSFQKVCPNLKNLELEFPAVEPRFQYRILNRHDSVPPGFRNLVELKLTVKVEHLLTSLYRRQGDSFTWETELFCDLLFQSTKLQSLVLKGILVPIGIICNKTVNNLNTLSLTRMEFDKELPGMLSHFTQLKDLELIVPTIGKPESLSDVALQSLANSEIASTLERLCIVRSSITDDCLREVLLNCTHLKYLNLEGCRGLSRGCKQKFNGKEIDKLKKKLSM